MTHEDMLREALKIIADQRHKIERYEATIEHYARSEAQRVMVERARQRERDRLKEKKKAMRKVMEIASAN